MSVRFSSLPGWVLVGLLGLVAGCITATPRPQSDPAGLVGRWEGLDDKGKHGVFVFRPDGLMSMSVDGKVQGDPSDRTNNGLRYTVDGSRTPLAVDVISYRRDTGEERGRFLAVVELEGTDQLRFRSHFNQTRPDGFVGATGDDTIVFRRVLPDPKEKELSVIGRWEGTDGEGGRNGFIFRENGTFVLIYKGERRGDPEGGKRITYRLDRNQVPTHLDVVGIEDGTQKEVVLGRGILEFKDRDHLRIRMGWEGTTRPLTFDGSSNNDTIELVRQPGN